MSLLQDENNLIEEVSPKNILVDAICKYLSISKNKLNIQHLNLSCPHVTIIAIVNIESIMSRRYYAISGNIYETQPYEQYVIHQDKIHINEFEYINGIECIEDINKFIKAIWK